MNLSISHQKASKAFSKVLEAIGRDSLEDILCNWNDYELSDDGKEIICYIGRDREYSKGKDGGKVKITKQEFVGHSSMSVTQKYIDVNPKMLRASVELL